MFLSFQELAFAFDTPAISRQGTIVFHDAMARDGDSKLIRTTGLCDSSRCLWSTDTAGDLGIACRFACGDLSQGLPDTLLENRALDIER
jgi:hypothetical protein